MSAGAWELATHLPPTSEIYCKGSPWSKRSQATLGRGENRVLHSLQQALMACRQCSPMSSVWSQAAPAEILLYLRSSLSGRCSLGGRGLLLQLPKQPFIGRSLQAVEEESMSSTMSCVCSLAAPMLEGNLHRSSLWEDSVHRRGRCLPLLVVKCEKLQAADACKPLHLQFAVVCYDPVDTEHCASASADACKHLQLAEVS